MHYLDHLLESPIGPSLKVLQLRRLFDWTNMAAALPQFSGAASHPCIEVSGFPNSFVQDGVHMAYGEITYWQVNNSNNETMINFN